MSRLCTSEDGARTDEQRPLLESGRSIGDDAPAEHEHDHEIQVSRSEFVWILVGLWCPVALGALDGEYQFRSSESLTEGEMR
jgi:hypothetical protein